MSTHQQISFGKIFFVSFFLILIGAGGIFLLLINTQPFLGPRWIFFFLLTLFTCGVGLPLFYFIQRRFSKKGLTEVILIRESILFAIYIDLMIWLQFGRVLNNVILVLLAIGFILIEVFLRISENAVFFPGRKADE